MESTVCTARNTISWAGLHTKLVFRLAQLIWFQPIHLVGTTMIVPMVNYFLLFLISQNYIKNPVVKIIKVKNKNCFFLFPLY